MLVERPRGKARPRVKSTTNLGNKRGLWDPAADGRDERSDLGLRLSGTVASILSHVAGTVATWL